MPVPRDAVIWAYRFLLGREPETEDVILRSMEQSDPAALARFIMCSREFSTMKRFSDILDLKTALPAGRPKKNPVNGDAHLTAAPAANDAFEKLRAAHNGPDYLTPTDLLVTPVALRRVMIIGSCLTQVLLHRKTVACPCDFVLTNNLGRLPKEPPHPAGDYDFQLVQVPLRFIVQDGILWHTSFLDTADYEEEFQNAVGRLQHTLEMSCRWTEKYKLLTFVSNFFVPQQNPIGRLMPRYDLRNPVYFIEQLNRAMAEMIAKYENAYLLDVDAISAAFGRKFVQDDGVCLMTHGSILDDFKYKKDRERIEPIKPMTKHYTVQRDLFVSAVWNQLIAMYRTVRQIDAVKMIILDLDNTLWRGVIAEEDEIENLEGWPVGLVEALCNLKKRGVMLAIVSKNDEGHIRELWDKMMCKRLSLDDFAVVKINWRPKAENIEEILKVVNILPRSVVFIDDNPVERAAVKMAFPEIRVLGTYPYYHKRILLWSPEIQVQTITAESSRRTEMMQSQVGREALRQELSRDDFLASLGVKINMIEINSVAHPKFARAFELLNKTNQFNTTGRRWTKEECDSAFAGGLIFHAFEVTDRFSEYGLVGCALLSGNRIEQFVMSCRVIGLDVETQVISQIADRVRESGASEVHAELIHTDANFPCREIFANSGFYKAENGWFKPCGSVNQESAAPLEFAESMPA